MSSREDKEEALRRLHALKQTTKFKNYMEASKLECISKCCFVGWMLDHQTMLLKQDTYPDKVACRNMVNLTIKQPMGIPGVPGDVQGSWHVTKTVQKDNGPPETISYGGGLSDLFKGGKEMEPMIAIEKELDSVLASLGTSMADLTGWMNRGLASISQSVGGNLAETQYKFCLADCIDDQEHTFPQSVAKCWIQAKSLEDVEKCQRQSQDLHRMKQLDAQISALEEEVGRMMTK